MRLPGNRKGRRHGSRNDRGAVQIEFVLSIMTIMFVLFAIWELIMIVHTMNVLSDAAKEGVRYAIVHGEKNDPAYQSGPGSVAAVQNLVRDYARLSFQDVPLTAIRVCYPPNCDPSAPPPGCQPPPVFPCGDGGTNELLSTVRVEVEYQFAPYTALPFRPALRAAAQGRIVY